MTAAWRRAQGIAGFSAHVRIEMPGKLNAQATSRREEVSIDQATFTYPARSTLRQRSV